MPTLASANSGCRHCWQASASMWPPKYAISCHSRSNALHKAVWKMFASLLGPWVTWFFTFYACILGKPLSSSQHLEKHLFHVVPGWPLCFSSVVLEKRLQWQRNSKLRWVTKLRWQSSVCFHTLVTSLGWDAAVLQEFPLRGLLAGLEMACLAFLFSCAKAILLEFSERIVWNFCMQKQKGQNVLPLPCPFIIFCFCTQLSCYSIYLHIHI